MKVYIHDNSRKLVRISFGYLESISFENTTVKEVFDKAIEIFSKEKLNLEFEIKDHNPTKKPETSIALVMQVREENQGIKGGSKSKTLYGLTAIQAKEILLKAIN